MTANMSKGQKNPTSFSNLKPAMRKYVFQVGISDHLFLSQQYVFQGRATSRAGLDTFRPTYIQWSCACTMCGAWKTLFPLASTKLSCRMRRFWWTGHTPSVKAHTTYHIEMAPYKEGEETTDWKVEKDHHVNSTSGLQPDLAGCGWQWLTGSWAATSQMSVWNYINCCLRRTPGSKPSQLPAPTMQPLAFTPIDLQQQP